MVSNQRHSFESFQVCYYKKLIPKIHKSSIRNFFARISFSVKRSEKICEMYRLVNGLFTKDGKLKRFFCLSEKEID